MIEVRPFGGLGRFSQDWLDARYHFSFADYVDPARMGFGPLRVWNDDLFRPGGGFPMHPHRDMEIITYVRQGAVSHQDSLGNKGMVAAGDIQVMSAGSGIVHSEFNAGAEDLRLFQIWVLPNARRLPPRWATTRFPRGERRDRLVAVACGRGTEGAIPIHQDATLFAADLGAGARLDHAVGPGRRVYLVPAKGRVRVNGVAAGERDGVAVVDEAALVIEAPDAAEVLLFDLPS